MGGSGLCLYFSVGFIFYILLTHILFAIIPAESFLSLAE